MNLAIGIPTYNGFHRVKLLLSSIFNYTTSSECKQIQIAVLDDGTPDLEERKRIEKLCSSFSVSFIQHSRNEGIPASWNDLTNFFSAEICLLLNDDIQFCHPAWFEYLQYFFAHNEDFGSVSFPVFYIEPQTGLPYHLLPLPDIDARSRLLWSPNGQGFAFKRAIFNKVAKFDESLTSFYEECMWGFQLTNAGYPSYQIPFPVITHWGSQTFAQNQELSYTVASEVLPMAEYRRLLSPKFPEEKIEPKPGFVYRMEYSRVLFALKWGCSDYWDKPQEEIEKRFALKHKPRFVRWLDKSHNERGALI